MDTTTRTSAAELMDDFSLKGEELRDTLDEIAGINRLLGGNSITLKGVKNLLKRIPQTETITIVDLGCGNGDMLRMLSEFGSHQGWDFNLIGIDANDYTVRYARELSVLYPNISYIREDIFGTTFESLEYDIALCTLTLHHFDENQLMHLLALLKKKSSIGIVINDLHRNALAYRLFQLIGFLFPMKAMAKRDGLVSILRGFKKEELVGFAKKLNISNYTIRWKWAFRYQWIISKI